MTLVSHKHEFLFLKTRKTAGSSTERFLQSHCAPAGVTVSEKDFLVSAIGIVGAINAPKKGLRARTSRWRQTWYHHMPAALVRKQLGARRFDRYLKISSVRNPFDRAVSLYYFHKHNRKIPLLDDFADLRRDFADYLSSRLAFDDWPIVSINDRFVVNEMIRFEHLNADLARICKSVGIQFDASLLPHDKNLKSLRQGRAVSEYFDPSTVEVVRRRMSWVFDRFEYPETPLDVQASAVQTNANIR